jgi:tungstate transport system substrate-binding protein
MKRPPIFRMLTLTRTVMTAAFLWAATLAHAQGLIMASTTSTEQSGLFSHLLPAFKAATGVDVKVVAVGTGQAIDMGRRGDADLLFVHDQAAEEKLVREGYATQRLPVMYNDFVLVGPSLDPSGLRGNDILAAFAKAATANTPFISRGDRSGTHAAELRYWKSVGVDPRQLGAYRECGCGMGPALNITASTASYALTDRATWLNFCNRADLVVLVQGDRQLFNQYGVLPVNPAKHPHVNASGAIKFVDWITSPAGQAVIAGYKINGEQLFFPNANP